MVRWTTDSSASVAAMTTARMSTGRHRRTSSGSDASNANPSLFASEECDPTSSTEAGITSATRRTSTSRGCLSSQFTAIQR
jgi:hypothetical protein